MVRLCQEFKSDIPQICKCHPRPTKVPHNNFAETDKSLIITELADANGGGECPNSIGLIPRSIQGKDME